MELVREKQRAQSKQHDEREMLSMVILIMPNNTLEQLRLRPKFLRSFFFRPFFCTSSLFRYKICLFEKDTLRCFPLLIHRRLYARVATKMFFR